jgi:uncharacterized protein YfaS (alpha-2-macroglobulin family)
LESGSYELRIQISDEYNNSYPIIKTLNARTRTYSALIYTDKGMYKPQDTVNFAIFCIDSEMRPYNPQEGVVKIFNSENIKIKSFSNISFVNGKYEGSIVLSDFAAEGIWRIDLESEDRVI